MKNKISNKVRSALRWVMSGVAIATAASGGSNALAQLVQPFTPGNIVVERVGNGGAALSSAGNPIFFDEYTTGGAGQTPVQSIAIPSSGTNNLIDGNSSANGEMTLATSGQLICFPGGVTNLANTVSLTSATSAQVPRGVGTLDANGNYSLVLTSSLAYSGGSLRGAATDGQGNFWGSGTATGVGGIYYLGLANPTNDIFSANLRCCGLFNGNLWYTTGSGTPGIGIWEFSGAPTGAVGNTATKIFSTTSSPYNFSVSPDGNTIFFADDAAGIIKLTQSGGIWTSNYVVFSKGCYGLLVDWSTTPATVYATTGSGVTSNAVVKISDTGANAVAVTNAIAGANKMFRNLSFTPTNATFVALAPAITGISPTSKSANVGGTATFALSGFTGNPIASNYWYKVTDSATNPLSSQTGSVLNLTNLALVDEANYFAVVSNVSGSVTSSVVSLNVTFNPTISSITPSSVITNLGSTVTFSLNASPGIPAASNFWYKISGSPLATNLITGATATNLTLSNVQFSDSANYFAVLTNATGSATSSVVTLVVTNLPPVITGIGPVNLTNNAGQTASFTVTNAGTAPFTYFWYQETALATNLISVQTNATLSLTNVNGGNTAHYQVIVSNVTLTSVTSAVVSLTVTNDPNLQVQPNNVQGWVGGTVQFSIQAAGTAPIGYQWYFSDTNGDLIAPASALGDGSVISGADSSTLTVANLQPTSLTNFMVVITNVYGSVTSSVASILAGTNNVDGTLPYSQVTLALWDFDGVQFTNLVGNPNCINNPAPFIGSGTALAVGTCYNPLGLVTTGSPFSGSVDPYDVGYDANYGGWAFTPYGFEQPSPNFSWGSDNYPASGSNKLNGLQFNVSTVGARNIKVNYDSRVSATANDYERLQYTTNGIDWVDYPASSTFSGLATTFYPFSYNLTGFPGVDNNPDFGFRIVTEFQSTASYGISANTNYVGTANTYGTGGTVTYDVVAITGDAITNSAMPPALDFADSLPVNSTGEYATNMVDTNSLTFNFSASLPNLTFTVAPVNTVAAGNFVQTINPSISAVTSDGSTNYQFTISFANPIPDPADAAPILVTATDTNGNSTASWFLLTVSSINQPPTNTLTTLAATNMLVNSSLTIPFTVGSARDSYAGLTYTVSSGNNTVIPANNIVINNSNPTNPTVTITPAVGQVGNSVITVTVNDNDPAEPRSTTATIAVIVRPNPNVVAIDYFNYNNSGSLDSVATNYWQHLSGVNAQMQVASAPVGGYAVVNDGNTENLQVKLLGNPYKTNSGAVLYSSLVVNIASAGSLPVGNGSYFACFNDGSGNTADVEACLVAATNGAAPGYYRLGIANIVGASATNAQMFPLDLAPGANYTVITSLALSNGYSTLWINPSNQSSASVTDTTPPATATNLYSIVNFELRESGSVEGVLNVGNILVGTTFNNVFYPPQANADSYSATENTGNNLFNVLANDAGSDLSLVSASETDGNGTVTISGTNVVFAPGTNFTGLATVSYTIMDDIGNITNSTIAVLVTNIPPVANPDSCSVAENSTGNVFNPLTNDAVQTAGGTLSLVSAVESDGNGTAEISGTNVLFTPVSGFTGTATISYTITDNIGGTNSSLITVMVVNAAPATLGLQLSSGSVVLTWSDSTYGLQYSTNVAGPYITMPAATSPYTNSVGTNAAGFFRLVQLAPN